MVSRLITQSTRRAAAGLCASLVVFGAACAPMGGTGGSTPPGSTATVIVAGEPVTVTVPSGLTVTVASATAALPPAPAGLIAPLGAIDVVVGNVTPGGSVTVALQLQNAVDSAQKLIAGAWNPFTPDGTTGLTLSPDGKTITLLLKDGARGDSDGTANGTIVDPLLPVKASAVSWFAVGCYDSSLAGQDFAYYGPADSLGNASIFFTVDGTCGGTGTSVALVQATSDVEGLAKCRALIPTSPAAGQLSDFGYAVPTDVYGCALGTP